MKDGEYRINVRADNIKLDYAYNGLNVSGLPSIDNITVYVNGTLYDDQNAVIGNLIAQNLCNSLTDYFICDTIKI